MYLESFSPGPTGVDVEGRKMPQALVISTSPTTQQMRKEFRLFGFRQQNNNRPVMQCEFLTCPFTPIALPKARKSLGACQGVLRYECACKSTCHLVRSA